MAYNEQLNDRIREAIAVYPNVEEKHMFGGVCYMLDGKMCVGVVKEEMMCRIDPAIFEEVVERDGCRMMDFTGKTMKGYVYVNADGMKTKQDFEYWINLCVEFNKIAKASKKKNTGLSRSKKNATE